VSLADFEITTAMLKHISTTIIAEALQHAGLLQWSLFDTKQFQKVHLTTSSKAASAGTCFVMFRGTKVDSHDFAMDAHTKGCTVFLGDNSASLSQLRSSLGTGVSIFCVTNARASWAFLEALANGNPQTKFPHAGITGTNGKTSTVWLMRGLVDQCADPMVTIGTLGIYFKDQCLPTSHTSPDPDFLYQALANAVDAGAASCGMEVSSHSLAQDKLWPVRFIFAAFTSFSRDHLDFHGTEDNYFAAKMRLFQELLAPGARVAFHHSLASRAHAAGVAARDCWIYGLEMPAAESMHRNRVTGSIIGETAAGSEVEIIIRPSEGGETRFRGTIPVFGTVFIDNFMAALIGCHRVTGQWASPENWARLRPVPGRMEPVKPGKFDPLVFVDYAHTPDALAQVLGFARKMASTRGTRVWCVFGCGGDRDRGKRPMMAAACVGLADEVIVTSDNPRSENPDSIIDEIMRGFPENFRTRHVRRIADRSLAIAEAVKLAGPGDVILIAGKGHETYQEIAGRKFPFDDRDSAADALKSRRGVIR